MHFDIELADIAIPALVSLATCGIAFFFKRPELVYAQKVAVMGQIAQSRFQAIEAFLKALKSMDSFEKIAYLDGANDLAGWDCGGAGEALKDVSTISVLSGLKSLGMFEMILHKGLEELSYQVSNKTRASIVALYQYLGEVIEVVDEWEATDACVALATLEMAPEVKRRIREVEACLVHEINSAGTRYTPQLGIGWRYAFWRAGRKYKKLRNCLDELRKMGNDVGMSDE